MLVVMGGAVAFIVFSILQPIMDLGQLHRTRSEKEITVMKKLSVHLAPYLASLLSAA